MTGTIDTKMNIVAYNCSGFKPNFMYINKLTTIYDCIFLSETWLTQAERHLVHNYKQDFQIIYTPEQKHINGRPFGGTLLLL